MALTASGLFRRARKVIPGGVNSPVRAWGAVGAEEPFFAARGDNTLLIDRDPQGSSTRWLRKRKVPQPVINGIAAFENEVDQRLGSKLELVDRSFRAAERE